jgi:hypothetical protein
MAPGEEYLGTSAADQAGSVTLVGQRLADFCAKPPVSRLVGQWTSVGFDIATTHITEHGGAGVKMHIDARGNGAVVYTGMTPVTFTTTSDQSFAGRLTYAGTTTGVVKLPPGGVNSGTWESAGPGTVSGLVANSRSPRRSKPSFRRLTWRNSSVRTPEPGARSANRNS